MGRVAWILVIVTIAVYVAIYLRTESLVLESVREQAVSYADLVLKTRAWNSGHGGVFVDKVTGVEENPYLRDLGVEPDVRLDDGRTFTMRNPAMMTREIAELLAQDSEVTFQLTSLDPVNPDNAPDLWERAGLEELQAGATEVGEVVDEEGEDPVYRYMVPLETEASCLKCHALQGYEVGDVRGGLSVSIPMERARQDLALAAVGLGGVAVGTLGGILLLVYFIASRVVRRLEKAERQLEHMATTDSLTDLWNRRYTMGRLREEFERSRRQEHDLGLVMLDLDGFKSINDRLGHGFGDLVLKATADRMRRVVRPYDTLGRVGGEEFLVVVPETDLEDVVGLAERIREAVSAEPVAGSGEEITITTSAGVAMLAAGDLTPDAILARADSALYAAKEAGRDRVAVGGGHAAT